MNAIRHSRLRVDLNAAGAGPLPAAVADVLARWTRVEDRDGSFELHVRLQDVLYGQLPARLGALLGAPAADTLACGGAAQVFAAVMSRLPLSPRDRVWVSPYESPAHLAALSALRARTGCHIDVIALGPDGDLDVSWMARHLDDDVALVCLPYVSAACGTVHPVEEVGRLLAGRRCLYAVDASYAVGQLPVDVAGIGCHLLVGDGWRFLRGPQSAGFAYAAPRLHEVLAPHGGLPSSPASVPALAALNTALAHHATTAAATSDTAHLTSLLRTAVHHSPGTELIAPGRHHSGIVTFRHDELPAALLRRRLADRGVLVGKIVADESPLYLPRRGITTAVRAGVHHDTTPRDIALFADALRDAIAQGLPQPTARARQGALRTVQFTAPIEPAPRARRALRAVPAPVGTPISACVPLPSSVPAPMSCVGQDPQLCR
ncbi:aminotransferase class V-fold PLP-dependent enzyme [Streptomyces sp. NPDC054842]